MIKRFVALFALATAFAQATWTVSGSFTYNFIANTGVSICNGTSIVNSCLDHFEVGVLNGATFTKQGNNIPFAGTAGQITSTFSFTMVNQTFPQTFAVLISGKDMAGQVITSD